MFLLDVAMRQPDKSEMQSYRLIKICGLTQIDDVRMAAALGADFLGFVMHPPSPRCATQEVVRLAGELFYYRPRVLVFGNDDPQYIEESCRIGDAMTWVQLPAGHSALEETTRRFSHERVLPVVGVGGSEDFLGELERLEKYPLVLLDTGGVKDKSGKTLDGGTGRTFNWELVKEVRRPFLAAGGLKPENIGEAIERLNSRGYDVSSGIESRPGVKDRQKMENLIRKIREA